MYTLRSTSARNKSFIDYHHIVFAPAWEPQLSRMLFGIVSHVCIAIQRMAIAATLLRLSRYCGACYACAHHAPAGVVAKWQGRSLQNSDRRFESARRLHPRPVRRSARPPLVGALLFAALTCAALLAACSGPDGSESRHHAVATNTATASASIATASASAITQPTSSPSSPATHAVTASPAATAATMATLIPSPTPRPSPTANVVPTVAPTPDPRPADQIVDLPLLDAHYALEIRELDLDSGYVDAGEVITIAAFDGAPPPTLYLQVVPAHNGFFTLDAASLAGAPVTPQTLNDGVTLAFDLPSNAQAPLDLALEFHLDIGMEATGWAGTSHDGDALRLGYWFPIISDDHPYSDTLDPSYSRVATFDVHVNLAPDVIFAHTGDIIEQTTLDDGRVRYDMHAERVRDFALCLSRVYDVDSLIAPTGTLIELYTLPASDTDYSDDDARARRQRILATAADALSQLTELLGPYPYASFEIADAGPDMPGGVEFPNLIYINPNYPELDRLIYHETAHQWMYGIIGNRTLLDGWIDEGGAEFFERGLPTGFTEVPAIPDGGYLFPLDSSWAELSSDPRRAWYYAIYEQGARFYDAVLAQMGRDAFWAALRDIYAAFAFGIVTPWDMLNAWQVRSASDLRPLYHATFRYDWLDKLPGPGG